MQPNLNLTRIHKQKLLIQTVHQCSFWAEIESLISELFGLTSINFYCKLISQHKFGHIPIKITKMHICTPKK